MVQMSRVAGKAEKHPFVGEWQLNSDVYASTGGNRYRQESVVDGDGQKDAHNGVRGDDVFEVREAQ